MNNSCYIWENSKNPILTLLDKNYKQKYHLNDSFQYYIYNLNCNIINNVSFQIITPKIQLLSAIN